MYTADSVLCTAHSAQVKCSEQLCRLRDQDLPSSQWKVSLTGLPASSGLRVAWALPWASAAGTAAWDDLVNPVAREVS